MRVEKGINMSAIDHEVIEQLSSQKWEIIYPKLTHYAALLTKKLYWKTGNADLPKGFQPDDLAKEAIASVYRGKRRWDYKKDPDLLKYLKSIIRSKVNHLIESAEHKRLQILDYRSEENAPLEPIDMQASTNPDALNILIEKDLREQLWEIAEKKNDENMQYILLCLLEKGMKGEEISDETKIPLNEVNNILKKIRRLYKKVDEE